MFAARLDGGNASADIIVACSEGGLYDLTRGIPLAWIGGPSGAQWVFSATHGSAASPLFAASASDSNLYEVACDVGACTATAVGALPWALGSSVQALVAFPAGNATSVWVSGDAGTAALLVSPAQADRRGALAAPWLYLPGVAANASAYSMALGVVALGNDTALTILDAASGALLAWDWVTDPVEGWGAPIDDSITALAYGPDGTLFIGNDICLNLRFANGSYARIDGPAGLPIANITSLAIDARTLVETPPHDPALPRVWIGSTMGAVLFDPSVDPLDDVNAAGPALYYGAVRRAAALSKAARSGGNADAPAVLPHAQRWRYFAGPRYLPVTPSDTLSTPVPPRGIVSVGDATAILSGGAGVAVLRAELWTLAQKAAWIEALQPAFDREYMGITGSCDNPAWGVSVGVSCGPDDNNGLWTAMLLGGLVFKAAVTRDLGDVAGAWHYFGGLKLLNDVTGIRGFPARSPTEPNETWPSGDPAWFASPSLSGWHFKGTTSSDEIVGHAFAYPLVKEVLAPVNRNVSGGDAAAALLLDIARNIVQHNFTLEGPDGLPTQWGDWNPLRINFNRSWSDNRAINSLEVLSFINAALDVAEDPADVALLLGAYDELVAAGYATNTRNTRINAPCDVNFSDDELLFLSHFTFLFSGRGQANESVRDTGLASVRQSWISGVAASRSTLYASMYLAMTGATPVPLRPSQLGRQQKQQQHAASEVLADGRLGDRWDPTTLQSLATVVWGLRTWPLELTDWPAANSGRLDLVAQPNNNRFGQPGDSTRVLPVNERVQGRWNADPYTMDGGGGGSQSDAGVYVLPYWLARYYGVLGAASAQ